MKDFCNCQCLNFNLIILMCNSQLDHYTFCLLATNPRPLQDLCRLVIRKTLGPQGSKRLHGLPLPPALIMYLNYFHEFRQG